MTQTLQVHIHQQNRMTRMNILNEQYKLFNYHIRSWGELYRDIGNNSYNDKDNLIGVGYFA